MDLKEMISNFESQYAQLIKEGNTHEAKIVDRAIKNAKSEMSKTEKASDSISPLTEKKNDSETQLAIAQQSASAAVADAHRGRGRFAEPAGLYDLPIEC